MYEKDRQKSTAVRSPKGDIYVLSGTLSPFDKAEMWVPIQNFFDFKLTNTVFPFQFFYDVGYPCDPSDLQAGRPL